jgi:methyltransferase-like protein
MTEWAKGSKNEGLNEEIKFMTITNERLEECMKKQTTDFLTKTVNEIMNKRINGKGEK